MAGFFSPDRQLGGQVLLRSDLAEASIRRNVAEKLRITVHEAAVGILSILVQNMVQAIELNSIQKGYDPREFALVAIGGAGPMFAVQLARELGIPRVVIPPNPGIGSAIGLLSTNVVYEFTAPVADRLSGIRFEQLDKDYAELTDLASDSLRGDGIDEARWRLVRYAECRFAGQAYEIRVTCPEGSISPLWLQTVTERFQRAYRGHFGRYTPDAELEITAIVVQGVGMTPALTLPIVESDGVDPSAAMAGERAVWFSKGGLVRRTPVYDRERLRAGHRLRGPAIVEQFDTTVVIDPGAAAEVDRHGSLAIKVEASQVTT